jgi:hypothetical protein
VEVKKSKELDCWNDSFKLSKAMFDEASVKLIIK